MHMLKIALSAGFLMGVGVIGTAFAVNLPSENSNELVLHSTLRSVTGENSGLAAPIGELIGLAVAVLVLTLVFRSVAAIVEPLRRSEAVRRTLRRLAFGRNANYYYRKSGDDEKSRAA